MNQPRPEVASPPPSLKHPGRWLWLFLLIPILLGLGRLRFDVEIFDLLPNSLPAVAGLKLYQQYFADARELIITIQGSSAEQTEAAARALAEQLRPHPELVSDVTWEPPWLEHPDQAAELLAYLWFNQQPQAFRELADRLSPEKLPAILSSAREELAVSMSPGELARLSYDPFGMTRLPESAAAAAPSFGPGRDMFSSSEGDFRLVFAQASTQLRTYRECERWLQALKQLLAEGAKPGSALAGVSLGYTGRPAFVAEVASGMEHDMTTSVGGTAAIIAVLFWLAHRRFKPTLWLLTLLALTIGSTLALGGLIFGAINVVSMGFAAILLGLAVDYAVVHYQEALAHPQLSIPQIRHAIAPSILWAAVTTIAAFLVLNLGGLPGLAQLGTMVGLGVALAATIMIFEFLPPLFPGRNVATVTMPAPAPVPTSLNPRRAAGIFAITGLLIACSAAILLTGLPKLDPTANALRPRGSPAYAALDAIQAHLSQDRSPLWLIVEGATTTDVARKLDEAQLQLASAVSNHLLASFTLPSPLWPHQQYQAENRATARHLADERAVLHRSAAINGFSETALALTDRLLDTWQILSDSQVVFWPTNPVSRWIFNKFAVCTPTNSFALALLTAVPGPGATRHASLSVLESRLSGPGVWLSGWELLGSAIFGRVKANLWKVLAPMVCLVLLSLYLAFRRPLEIALSLSVLFLSGLALLMIMRLTGWSWNLLNLMAIPLILGTGVDYSIFMQLALRRHGGDLALAYRSVGRALLLCGGTAVAAFGSLGLSSNVGMASLGQVCAVGIGSNMLIAILLLPTWWRTLGGVATAGGPTGGTLSPPKPSSLYCARLWQLGLWLVRRLPRRVCLAASRGFVALYWGVASHRRELVVRNLMPACGNDRAVATAKGRMLFRNFAHKVVDLWSYEAGLSIDELFGQTSGWEHFVQAQAQQRGVLLLSPHLGNWEFGAPLLTRRGVAVQVLTLAEPGEGFTQLRAASRARWKIETLVVGDDPLSFLEIIRRLESGATVALLIDRPSTPTSMTVELFGQPFVASVAAAELARASGCALLPVYLPLEGDTYGAHILPPVQYERAALRDRAARQRLTQEIVRVLEPVLRYHIDQWYHFVPIWPPAPQSSAEDSPSLPAMKGNNETIS